MGIITRSGRFYCGEFSWDRRTFYGDAPQFPENVVSAANVLGEAPSDGAYDIKENRVVWSGTWEMGEHTYRHAITPAEARAFLATGQKAVR